MQLGICKNTMELKPVTIVVLLAVACAVKCEECPPNEEYRRCASCPPTQPNCDDIRRSCDRCVCKDGYLRESEGRCVPEREYNKCPPNEEFKSDVSCPPTKPNCTGIFSDRCVCKNGYSRESEGGPCVARKASECPPNEEYKLCQPCPPTQPNCEKPPRFCDRCVCKNGYLRDPEGGRCVLKRDFGGCPPNEEYRPCDPVECPPTMPNCTLLECEICDCKDGYSRDPKDNRCIPDQENSQKCGPNEEFLKCQPAKPCLSQAPPSHPTPCFPGCYCKLGYMRNVDKLCVLCKGAET